MTGRPERDYVLGTHDAEIDRLGLQHRVWRPYVLKAFQRAGLGVGHTVVDLGCGPGYVTLDLAEIVGPTGRVHAIERSARFLGATQISRYEHDLDDKEWPDLQVDFAWCRWVAAFVRKPRALVDHIGQVVKPGGRLIMHEYLDYSTWRLLPDEPEFAAFVAAVIAAWRQSGGEPDIGRELPAWLEEAGFELDWLDPIVEVVSPSDFMWHWPKAFLEVGLERLVALGVFDQTQAAEVWRRFLEREASPHARMSTPLVLEIGATRRH